MKMADRPLPLRCMILVWLLMLALGAGTVPDSTPMSSVLEQTIDEVRPAGVVFDQSFEEEAAGANVGFNTQRWKYVAANPALCGAAGAAASNVVRTSLSGEERFSPGGFAVETLAGGALGLGAGRLFETVPRLRINPNWFKPSNIRNVWNPGPWSRRAYAQSGIEAGAGALGGFGTRSLVGC